jgi:hypothetical protein
VKVEYYENAGDAVAQVSWTGPPVTTCPAGQFLANYYSNQTLSGTVALARCESRIDYLWGAGSPGPTVPSDHFSARWVGDFAFDAGTTQFSVTADDGIRLWIDDVLLIDKWIDQSATTYTATRPLTAGTHRIRVEYYDNAVDAVARLSWATVSANGPPVPAIATPAPTLHWRVGDTISFSGSATDPEDGTLPASALSWTLILHHCPSNCHTHTVQSWNGVSSGSFSAPDHEYPSYLELALTATDSAGSTASTSVQLDPAVVDLSFAAAPSGLQLVVNGTSTATPFTRTVIVGSTNTVSAVSPQTLNGTSYSFASWSDGGAQTHSIVAPASPATYTATFAAASAAPSNSTLPAISGQPKDGQPLFLSNGTWTGATPMSFAYQWLRCSANGGSCAPIAGATSATYTLVGADIGARLRGRVTATNAVASAAATSDATAMIKRK